MIRFSCNVVMEFNYYFFLSTSIEYSFDSAKNKLNNIIKLGNDKNEKCNNANVVYQIKCKDCNASYVGQTSSRLNVRTNEHAKKYSNKDENSGLFLHTKENNHSIDFNNIKILDTELNNGKRLFSEAFIHTQKNYLNKQYEINRLPNEYNTFIRNCDFITSK